eukprot:TRINITY_DN37656_c0_g1_i1.p1 TRINITY_DN37656_c0_g1~~TRINITY_DN37656_c0_g1_i1.p1  ORF type:complete len:205 (+),score=19.34 TRINITY_DN37656_c0_g1_i1:92-706(+)
MMQAQNGMFAQTHRRHSRAASILGAISQPASPSHLPYPTLPYPTNDIPIHDSSFTCGPSVKLCLDTRQHETEGLAFPGVKSFQGPALYAYNDAKFTRTDFESIQKVGNSEKKTSLAKTGRFGIGFNVVYHITDLPSFVSGEYLVYFDPHCKFLPKVSPANPGKLINFVKHKVIERHPNQFAPFQVSSNIQQVVSHRLTIIHHDW